jgi:hypothetical protein
VKLSTRSLFESEMVEQVQAAEVAVREAEDCDDALSADAARNHLDNLLSLARRNGLSISSELSSAPTPPRTITLTVVDGDGAEAIAPAV